MKSSKRSATGKKISTIKAVI